MSAEPAPPRPTPLDAQHRAAGGVLVPFSGWALPLHYGSQLDEHHATRRAAGLFDVSHMLRVEVRGPDATAFLRALLAFDVARLAPGRGAYGCMLNDHGGILDDLIAYCTGPEVYLLVLNAGPAARSLSWLRTQVGRFELVLTPTSSDAMLAVQGPQARAAVHAVLGEPPDDLPRLGCAMLGEVFLARSGYTGEDGYELIAPAVSGVALWRALVDQGVRPAGLGARDTLRLEAGLNLYGQDMDDGVLPDECGLAWTVHTDDGARDFVGRDALLARRAAGVSRRRTGLVLAARGVARAGLALHQDGRRIGVLTSGGFGPTLGRGIGLARLAGPAEGACIMALRGRELPARLIRPPFVRGGVPAFELPALEDPNS